VPYNNLVSRTDVAALIPEEVSNAILKGLVNESAALNMFRQVPMSRGQARMPVLSALPIAYFVTGDTGLKQTTEVNWANKDLIVEEIAAIVPIPEAVVADSDFDAWGSVTPLLQQAAARTADAAIFFGVNKPASWPTAIVPGAVAAGHVVARGTNTVAEGGIAEDINDAMAFVENDGFDVNMMVAHTRYRALMRGARDTTGQSLLDINQGIYGVQTAYPMRGLWPTGASAAELVLGDREEAIVGIRQDVEFKVLTEAVITDNTNAIIFNLPQQDMIALRMTFRLAFQVSNAITYDNANEGTRYPFSVVRSPA